MAGGRETVDPKRRLNEAPLAGRDRESPGAEGDLTGGEPSDEGPGEASDRMAGGDRAGGAMSPGNTPFGAGAAGGIDGGGIAAEAASYGPADGALADAARDADPGAERLSGGPTGGEAIGQGAARGATGSGTPRDRGETGGGGPLGEHGGTGPQGAASPGGDSRR